MQSSALEYRPTKWDEVVGHESTIAALQNLLATKTPGAIGFSGEPGTGKTTLARIVAQAVQPEFSLESLDIRYRNCADHNGVDDARALAEDANYHPLNGKYLVFILDEAHKFTAQAQEALLVPTEAKGSSTIWIFCTTEPQKLIPALRSRFVWFDLKGFGPKETRKLLQTLADKNKASFPEELYTEIVTKPLTSPRDICYAYDLVVSGLAAKEAVQTDEREIQYVEIAQSLLKGVSGWPQTAALLRTLKANDAKPLRGVLASYLRVVLLNSSGPKAQALAEFLIRLAAQDTFEDSVSLAATTAALQICSTKFH